MRPLQPPAIGTRFGKLTTISEQFHKFPKVDSKQKLLFVTAKCDCGESSDYILSNLRKGNTTSCGCVALQTRTKHGFGARGEKRHPIYQIHNDMKMRCHNPNNPKYNIYGGRGIMVCDEWRDNPEVFIKWALENGWKPGLSIDRFPNMNGNYEPGNCRWATPKQQARNTRRTKLTELRVKHIRLLFSLGTKTKTEIATLYGTHPSTINNIIQNRIWQ